MDAAINPALLELPFPRPPTPPPYVLPIPQWVLDHSELKRAGIHLNRALKDDFVFLSDPWKSNGLAYVVKIIPPEDEMELKVYAMAANDPSLRKHILQCNVIQSESHPALLVLPYVHMPMLNFFTFTDLFYQILKGMEALHSRHIAHMDITCDNLVVQSDSIVYRPHEGIREGQAFIIDFEYSRLLDYGPGDQSAVELPYTRWRRPKEGITHLDPYAWDVFCLGVAFNEVLYRSRSNKRPRPSLARWFGRWLAHEESPNCPGTHGVCRCRPTMARARRVFGVLRWFMMAQEVCDRAYMFLKELVWKPEVPMLRYI